MERARSVICQLLIPGETSFDLAAPPTRPRIPQAMSVRLDQKHVRYLIAGRRFIRNNAAQSRATVSNEAIPPPGLEPGSLG